MDEKELSKRVRELAEFKRKLEFDDGNPGSPVSDYLFSLNLPNNENIGFSEWVYVGPGESRGLMFDVIACPVHNPKGEIVTYWMMYMENNEPAKMEAAAAMMPSVSPILGSAIRLTEVSELMGIAIGIENALAVTQIYGVNCWAAPSNEMFGMFVPPAGVKQLIIYSDNHQDCVRQQEAYKLAGRLNQNTEVVTVICFPMEGDSYIDLVVTDERNKAAVCH